MHSQGCGKKNAYFRDKRNKTPADAMFSRKMDTIPLITNFLSFPWKDKSTMWEHGNSKLLV